MNPAGCNQHGREAARPFPATIQTGYGDDMKQKPMPRIVPCSTLARWWLAFRRFMRD